MNNNNNNNEEDNKNENRFSVNSLINIFLYFEHLCWEESKNNLNEQYKTKIPPEKIEIINEFFNNYNKENDKLIKKEYLAAAIRRFISRYLSGKRADVDINESQDLLIQLARNDLWKFNLTDDQDRFSSELYQLGFELKVEHAYEYYELLGGDKLDTNFERNEQPESKQNEINENENKQNEINVNQRNEEGDQNQKENNLDNNKINNNEEERNNHNEIQEGNENENGSQNNDDNDEMNEEDNDDDENDDEEISC